MRRFKQRLAQPENRHRYACWGARGASYWCLLSIAGKGEMGFGIEAATPYLSVSINDGYDTDALASANWQSDGEQVWQDFGPVDYRDAEQSEELMKRVLENLQAITLKEPAK